MGDEKRKSVIEKKLEFVINVGNYESLRVSTSFGETIEWSTPEERQKKLDSLTKSLAQEVAKDAKEIMIAYGLKRNCSALLDKKGKIPMSSLDDLKESDEKIEPLTENNEDDEDVSL